MPSHKRKGIVTKRSDPPLASQSNQVGVALEGPTPRRMPRSLAMALLLGRDPLFREWSDRLSEIRGTPKEMEAQLGSKMKMLRKTLHKNYPAIKLIFLEQSNEKQGKFVVALENEKRCGPLRYTSNVTTFASGSSEITQGDAVHPWQFPGPMNANAPPAIFFQIDLSRVTIWDLQRLARDFKRILRASLLGSDKSLLGWPASEPKELAFLRTVGSDFFYRDLQRYDLHIKHGLTYRLIALLEVEGKANNLDQIPRQRRVGKKIPVESSISDSVQRIYQAIYRKKYNSKRRRLDTPAVGMEPYHCPTHSEATPGRGCPRSCSHLKTWWSKVQPTLSSDQTGL